MVTAPRVRASRVLVRQVGAKLLAVLDGSDGHVFASVAEVQDWAKTRDERYSRRTGAVAVTEITWDGVTP